MILQAANAEITQQKLVSGDKSDYATRGEGAAHKFGVEVKPNSQFHHTTTDRGFYYKGRP